MKYAIFVTLEEYQALNNKIGQAKSYPDLKSDTLNYADPNPESVNGIYYLPITGEVQEKWPEVLEGITLIDQIPQDDQDQIESDPIGE